MLPGRSSTGSPHVCVGFFWVLWLPSTSQKSCMWVEWSGLAMINCPWLVMCALRCTGVPFRVRVCVCVCVGLAPSVPTISFGPTVYPTHGHRGAWSQSQGSWGTSQGTLWTGCQLILGYNRTHFHTLWTTWNCQFGNQPTVHVYGPGGRKRPKRWEERASSAHTEHEANVLTTKPPYPINIQSNELLIYFYYTSRDRRPKHAGVGKGHGYE